MDEILSRQRVEILMIGELGPAGIIDQEIDPPERLQGGGGERTTGGILDDIGLHRDRALPDFSRQRFGIVTARGVIDHAAHTACGKPAHHRGADPGAAASDDRDRTPHACALGRAEASSCQRLRFSSSTGIDMPTNLAKSIVVSSTISAIE